MKEMDHMSDYIVKGLAFDGTIRVLGARTTETTAEAQRRHQAWPTATAALGRTLTGTVMLGSMLKGDGKLTVKIEGGGPAGAILADADANGHVRGYISDPYVHFDLNNQGKLDVRIDEQGTRYVPSAEKKLIAKQFEAGRLIESDAVTLDEAVARIRGYIDEK